jgi:hypothetical protein
LFDELWGFGEATTGALGGQIYVVNRRDESGENGTLHYGIWKSMTRRPSN